jgi:2-phosphoglycerate kinase
MIQRDGATMIYLIGGAPRSGKSTLCQRFARGHRFGWIATDVIKELLPHTTESQWNASPEAIAVVARRFAPYLEKIVWGVSSLASNYVIEGVEICPEQVADLSRRFDIRSVFLGCSAMTLERFDRFPGKSQGYAGLSKDVRARMSADIPMWSSFVRDEAKRYGLPYIDTSDGFESRLDDAVAELDGSKTD